MSDVNCARRTTRANPAQGKSDGAPPVAILQAVISQWPFTVTAAESLLLNRYLQRFSSSSLPHPNLSNPFLRVVLPLSAESRTIFDLLLALGGMQSLSNGYFLFDRSTLLCRQNALRGCRDLIQELSKTQNGLRINDISYLHARNSSKTLYLLISCVLLLLFEGLSGDLEESGRIHLCFLSQILSRDALLQIVSNDCRYDFMPSLLEETLQFVINIYLYNDFLLSTATRSKALSKLHLAHVPKPAAASTGTKFQNFSVQQGSRFVFPNLMTRIAAGDVGITDLDIANWNGDLGWLPGFALLRHHSRDIYSAVPISIDRIVMGPEYRNLNDLIHISCWEKRWIATELYRISGSIYRRHCAAEPQSIGVDHCVETAFFEHGCFGNLPLWSMQLLEAMPIESGFDISLLWPIRIIGKTLTASQRTERSALVARLQSIDKSFQSRLVRQVMDDLQSYWSARDRANCIKGNLIITSIA